MQAQVPVALHKTKRQGTTGRSTQHQSSAPAPATSPATARSGLAGARRNNSCSNARRRGPRLGQKWPPSMHKQPTRFGKSGLQDQHPPFC
uniref:Uncharacterized protein n=1 Tax=Aegilops tauschii subsp. strangulata TaxID=200361 RepID=A0A453RD12_AEGTS